MPIFVGEIVPRVCEVALRLRQTVHQMLYERLSANGRQIRRN